MSAHSALAARHCPEFHLEIDGNASLSTALVADLNNVCDRVEEAGQNSVVLVHVRGRQDQSVDCFWPGNLGDLDIHLVNQWEQALRRIERLSAVTVAAVQGICAGVALEVLLATDHRVASNDLRIRLKAPSGEIWPGMFVFRLANQIGIARSRRVALFGGEISVPRAVDLGLIDEVADELEAATRDFIESLGHGSPPDLALRRRLLLDAPSMTFEDALGSHLAACDRIRRNAQRLMPGAGVRGGGYQA